MEPPLEPAHLLRAWIAGQPFPRATSSKSTLVPNAVETGMLEKAGVRGVLRKSCNAAFCFCYCVLQELRKWCVATVSKQCSATTSAV